MNSGLSHHLGPLLGVCWRLWPDIIYFKSCISKQAAIETLSIKVIENVNLGRHLFRKTFIYQKYLILEKHHVLIKFKFLTKIPYRYWTTTLKFESFSWDWIWNTFTLIIWHESHKAQYFCQSTTAVKICWYHQAGAGQMKHWDQSWNSKPNRNKYSEGKYSYRIKLRC